jgi:cytochrome c556
MSCIPAICAAQLQGALDAAHGSKISNWAKRTQELNEQLRNVIYPLTQEIQKHLNDPAKKGKPHDLGQFEDELDRLETIYKQYRNEFRDAFPKQSEEIEKKEHKPILTENKTQFTEEDLKVLEKILEELKNYHNDTIQGTTNSLYLQGQLFVTVTQILLQNLQRTQEEHGRNLVYNQLTH